MKWEWGGQGHCPAKAQVHTLPPNAYLSLAGEMWESRAPSEKEY